VLWTAATGAVIEGCPAVASGVVYVGSYDDNLYAFNAASGALLWSAPTGNSIFSSPAVANGVVYVGSYDHISTPSRQQRGLALDGSDGLPG